MQKQDERPSSEYADAHLYERYAISIFAYLRLHTSSLQDAEDLLSEVFTIALEQDNLSWLTEKQQFSWLRRVAQNKLVDRYRRSVRISLLPLTEIVETICIEETFLPEQIALKREEMEQLLTLVKKLPLFQQQVLQLRLSDELPFAEIAMVLDKREETVRKTFSRTLASLRKMYRS